MKVFLISPVRGISNAYLEQIRHTVEYLEKQGHQVYWPARDTNQSNYELQICSDNRRAIEEADMVYVIWDGKSKGCLFDLGMAFALGKPVRAVLGMTPRATTKKSFQNLIYQLDDE